MTVRASGGPSRAPKRAARWGPSQSSEESNQGSSDEEITSSSSSEDETEDRKNKRLQLDEGLLRRVRRVQQQQQERQQQNKQKKRQGLLLLGPGEGEGQQQQQWKPQQVQLQRQLHAKLIGLRVTTNTAINLANKLPAADVLQLLQEQQEQETKAAVGAVRKEAARTFVLLRQLQQLLLHQSSLAAAYTAAQTDGPAATATAAAAEGGWQQRREAYKQQHVEGGETDLWRLLGDGPATQAIRSVCLSNADAWHQQVCAGKERKFSVFHQPVSVQLKAAMENEEEKLLRRALHICGGCSSSAPEQDNEGNKQGEKETKINGKTDEDNRNKAENEAKGACPVVACAEMKKVNKETQHQIFDDTDFYVELLKASVAAGEGQVEASTLSRETALLNAKRKARGKTVDRRASKGRKIRYKPIPQLESFVTAIPWTPNTDVLPGADDPLVVEGLMNNLFAAT
ncbi:hypothetical protein, conserved [Eimeria brunetti]|uniref:Uncharacterized protein n=1 Tax=Eimeria brunetti TaxID=51314 RepID=U6L9C6_9EIME|nr:hypothetical protein, conserved [Eimeria brunetti]